MTRQAEVNAEALAMSRGAITAMLADDMDAYFDVMDCDDPEVVRACMDILVGMAAGFISVAAADRGATPVDHWRRTMLYRAA